MEVNFFISVKNTTVLSALALALNNFGLESILALDASSLPSLDVIAATFLGK